MKEIKLTEDTKLKSKIHKNKLNVRPIINNIDHLTSLLSLLLDHMRFSSHEISMRSQMRFSHGQ